MSILRAAPVTLLAVAAALALPALAAGQSSAPSTLLLLRGERVHVSYTPGSLERAVRVQEKLGAMFDELTGWSKTQLVLQVRLLARDEWATAGLELPYGFPVRQPPDGLALAAWGDEGTVALWRRLSGGRLFEADALPLRGSVEEAASLGTGDIVAYVEAVRLGLGRARLGGHESWVTELLTHTAALSMLARAEPLAIDRIEAIWEAIGGWGGGGPLPLSAYRPGIELDAWLAYQARFHRGARLLVEEIGPKAGRELVRLARKRGGVLKGAELLERYPELGRWREESFSGGAASDEQ